MKVQIFSRGNTVDLLQNVEKIVVEELSEDLYPNDSIDEIIIDDVLSFTSHNLFGKCIDFCCNKLRINGEMIVKDLDIDILCRNTFDRVISTEQFNLLISNRTYVHSLQDVKKEILNHQLVIDTLETNRSSYIIKCKKL
jgi:hypothetical protein